MWKLSSIANFNTGQQKQEKVLYIYTEAVKQVIIHVKWLENLGI